MKEVRSLYENPFYLEDETEDCPLNYTLAVIGGKWKIEILFLLYQYEMLHYGQLKRFIKGISHKVLSSQLKELIRDTLISRNETDSAQPMTEYRLTKHGQSVLPIMKVMYDWGKQNRPNVR
jgi:DNA-binding HxlR family transcriptional regulator